MVAYPVDDAKCMIVFVFLNLYRVNIITFFSLYSTFVRTSTKWRRDVSWLGTESVCIADMRSFFFLSSSSFSVL